MSLKKFLKGLLSAQLDRVPVGMAEFEVWAADIIALSGLPDNDSMRWTLATMILAAKSDAAYVSKEDWVALLIKAAANQVASQVMQDLKEKQRAEWDAKQKAEVISVEPVASNGSQI